MFGGITELLVVASFLTSLALCDGIEGIVVEPAENVDSYNGLEGGVAETNGEVGKLGDGPGGFFREATAFGGSIFKLLLPLPVMKLVVSLSVELEVIDCIGSDS